MGGEGIDQLLQVSLQDPLQPVEGQTDAVVGHPALREIVGPDTAAAVSGADLAFAFLGALLVLFLGLDVEQSGAQDL